MTNAIDTMTITNWLSTWVHGLNLETIPPAVLHQARRALLDTVGVMSAGAVHPITAKTRAGFTNQTGSTSIVGGGTATPQSAALINAAAAHAYDFDDVSNGGILHASSIVASATLAAAQSVNANDKHLLEAFIAGSEVTYTLADTLTQEHYFQGWWPTATLPVIGASAAVAKLHGMTRKQIGHAMGLATAHSGGTRSVFGTDGKAFLCGFAAKAAVEFAMAAGAEITGPADAFENKSGFLRLLNHGVLEQGVLETLGTTWRLVEPGLIFKRYPVCSSAQTLVEESASLRARHGFDVRDVATIACRVPPLVAHSLVYDKPQTHQQCQFSIPFSVACGVHHGGVELAHVSGAGWLEPPFLKTMEKVRWKEDSSLAKDPVSAQYPECAGIVIELNDKSCIEGLRLFASGMPHAPLSDTTLTEKFLACLRFAGVSKDAANHAMKQIL